MPLPTGPPSNEVQLFDQDVMLVDQPVNLDFFDISGCNRMNWFEDVQDNAYQLSTLSNLPTQLLTNTVVEPFSWSFPFQGVVPTTHDTISSGLEPHTTLTASSPAASKDSGADSHVHDPGLFYVAGEPSRQTRHKRRLLKKPRDGSMTQSPQLVMASSRFSLAHEAGNFTPHLDSDTSLPPETYAILEQWYAALCLELVKPSFEEAAFPSNLIFGHLVHLYHEHFDASLPIIHRAARSNTSEAALQSLAMATIGTHYLPEDLIQPTFTAGLQEFLARAVEMAGTERGYASEVLARVRLLSALTLLYSGDDVSRRTVLDDSNILTNAYRTAKASLASPPHLSRSLDPQDRQFMAWLNREQSIRLMCAAWQLDYMWKYQFQVEPRLAIADASMPLPCSAKLWSATTSSEWAEALKLEETHDFPLTALLTQLYVDKSISDTSSDFATSLLINGILRRTYEVGTYYLSPLSSYEPSPAPQKSSDVLPHEPIWLPSIPEYVKWQNSACDAIDILHWQANAAIGLASGMEHPAVLHLHISRVVLLVPYDNIISLAEAWAAGRPINTADRDLLRRWVTEGQYKARLAVVHAGVTLWHVRRYSIDAFYEASAIALATLTLWAFATFANHKRQGSQGPEADNNDSNASIILLDRPTDDELVQDFIRYGRDMRTYLTGIGDLYDAGAPRKVLQQGCKLLGTLSCWSINDRWLDLFNRLAALHD